MNPFEGLGGGLRLLRWRAGLSAKEMAQRIGVRRQYVTAYEMGKNVSVDALARILEVTGSDLLELERAILVARHFNFTGSLDHPGHGRPTEAALTTGDGVKLPADPAPSDSDAQLWLERFKAAWNGARPPVHQPVKVSAGAEKALLALGLHTLTRRKRHHLLTILQSLQELHRPNPAKGS